MKEILLNLANNLLVEFCQEHQIDCSGTRVVKDGRGFAYVLRKDSPVDPRVPDVARITFHKSQVPTYGWR